MTQELAAMSSVYHESISKPPPCLLDRTWTVVFRNYSVCVNGAPFCKRDRTKSTMCDVMLGHERHVTNIHFALQRFRLPCCYPYVIGKKKKKTTITPPGTFLSHLMC
ncbi:uncharacterized protein LOC111267847 isoform X2 [Varroa jacobsoni]|uniref:uncharacterized protein LOC111267847 isoform X2 n=1 Tax=Varroa jacobsoni TaxID=62625 RepID=UPI000BF3667B|nr:uncharacterized protein LOC111267847 isoform X2 [Varroa jacobsoni]